MLYGYPLYATKVNRNNLTDPYKPALMTSFFFSYIKAETLHFLGSEIFIFFFLIHSAQFWHSCPSFVTLFIFFTAFGLVFLPQTTQHLALVEF